MRWPFVIAIALPIALATGCRDEQLAKLEAVRTEVCACKTAECAEAAMKQLPGTGESTARSRKMAKEVVDCLQRLLLRRDDTHAHEHDEGEREGNHEDEHAGSASTEGSAGAAQPTGSAN
ncbi:MAG: hypothetical protein SFX73_28375 [Kofleriaceae bacterium]|nr:hypothetical protein [Kofleriaceae bacterium]